jgi:hypothetical protein
MAVAASIVSMKRGARLGALLFSVATFPRMVISGGRPGSRQTHSFTEARFCVFQHPCLQPAQSRGHGGFRRNQSRFGLLHHHSIRSDYLTRSNPASVEWPDGCG